MNIKIKRLFICVLAFIIAFITLSSIKVIASAQTIEIIICNPGEDASKEARFSWHSTMSSNTFLYTSADDTSFSKAKSFNVVGVYDDEVFALEEIKTYHFTFELSDLTFNTKYLYKIRAGNTTSPVHSFTTANLNGEFDFVWMSDNHVHSTSAYTERISYNVTMLNKVYQECNPKLVVHSGDMVSTGGKYITWQAFETMGVLDNNMIATAVGNHDTYINASVGQINSSDPDLYFREMMNNPKNGPDEITQSYYYLYNSVLFVVLDAINANQSSTVLRAQKTWFRDVMEEMEGKYQYLIVYQHYPFANALTGAISGPYGTNMNQWYELFDEFDVDLALSGDHHFYYRTKPLIAKEIVTEEKKGTVYIGAPQTGKRDRGMTNDLNPEYYDFRSNDTADSDGTSGLTYFRVTNDGITGTLIDQNCNVIDTYTVKAKRNVCWENKKEETSKSYVFTSDSSSNCLNMNPLLSIYISKFDIYKDNTLLESIDVKKMTNNNILLSSLEKNKVYNLKVVTTFLDNTSMTSNILASTYLYHGVIYGLNAKANGDKITINWKHDLKNNIVQNYKILINGRELTTLSIDKTAYDINKADFNINDLITLQALNNDGNPVQELNVYYSVYGDYNMDNNFNMDDVHALLASIRESHSFGYNEKRLIDQNNDNRINIADATILYQYLEKQISSIKTESFNVIVLDGDGNILSIQKIEYGHDATIVSFSDSNFDHWSSSFNYITTDTVIKLVRK